MPSDNKIVVASAGSRKTTYIVESALSITTDQPVLILAYTNNTLSQIRKYIIDRAGYVPPNITIQSWHSFLFSECIKPYQNSAYNKHRIEQIFYPPDIGTFKRSRRFIKKEDTEKYFLVNSKNIIAEHLSEFALICNANSGGLVFNRLENIYQQVFIDESQDLAGYDFHIVESFLESRIKTTLVGDCRQATYFTNNSSKNKKFKGSNIIDLFNQWNADGLCEKEEKNECYRSNQAICDFGDSLYPELTSTQSVGVEETQHDGILILSC
jgi:DNA helicase-2/ATP-dependent DNA helicase PcrA